MSGTEVASLDAVCFCPHHPDDQCLCRKPWTAMGFGIQVTLQTHGLDKYGCTLADVLSPDGANVNHILVKEDWCWWYQRYVPGDTVLEGLEAEAREARKGLWADPQPVPPWAWRHKK